MRVSARFDVAGHHNPLCRPSHSPEPPERPPHKKRRLSYDPLQRPTTSTSNPNAKAPLAKSVDRESHTPNLQLGSTATTRHNANIPKSQSASAASKTKTTFASLNVHPWLVHALQNMSITRPTSIQAATIPEILAGRDCIGGSRTGTGKTLAFAVPILQIWAADPTAIFAVVLTPTRELALQLYEQFRAVAAPQALRPVLITGGADMRAQAIELAGRPHVVIATPGRLADHIRTSGEETIRPLRRVRFLVLDEADRLLAGGSGSGSMLPDVSEVLSALPPSTERQTLLFTATMTDEVRALRELPRPPGRREVFVSEISSSGDTITTTTTTNTTEPAPLDPPALTIATPKSLKQTYLKLPTQHKEAYLHVLLTTPLNTPKSTLIFVNTTRTATILTHLLALLSHPVTSLHSALPQRTRTQNLARFRSAAATGTTTTAASSTAARILVATDLAARGLDIPQVALVINFDLPRDPDDYVHRVGRTARAGRSGEAVSLVGQRDVERVLAVEGRVGVQLEEWAEEGVSVEGRVVRGALKEVGELKREAVLLVEQGRDVVGRKKVGRWGA